MRITLCRPAGRPLHIHICIHAAMIYLMSIRRKARIAAPGAMPYGGHPFVIQQLCNSFKL